MFWVIVILQGVRGDISIIDVTGRRRRRWAGTPAALDVVAERAECGGIDEATPDKLIDRRREHLMAAPLEARGRRSR
jgi:hypothetical protein